MIERTAELAASEERSRTILDLSSDAFIAIASDGRIVNWNTKAESVFGYPREEALGKPLDETDRSAATARSSSRRPGTIFGHRRRADFESAIGADGGKSRRA